MRFGNLALVAAAATLLQGCNTIKENIARGINLPSSVQSDQINDFEIRGQRLNELREALWQFDLVGGQSNSAILTLMPPKPSSNAQITISSTTPIVIRDASYLEVLQRYGRARRDYVDGVCSIFFNRLSEIQNDTDWGRSQFNIIAEFATLMLGLSGAGSEQLAVISGVQLGVNDSVDAAERALLLSPDPHKVFELVKARQAEFPLPTARNVAEMDTHIRTYAQPCTFAGIKAIIDGALTNELQGKRPEQRLAENNRAISAVQTLINQGRSSDEQIGTISTTTASDLYLIFVLAAGQSEAQKRAIARLSPTEKTAVEAALLDGGRRGKLREALEEMAATSEWVKTYAAQSLQADQREAQLLLEKKVLETEKNKSETPNDGEPAIDGRPESREPPSG